MYMETENQFKTIIKNSSFLITISIISIIIGYFLRIFLSKTLSIDDFGLFYSILAFLGLFTLIRHLGLNQMLAKYIPEFIIDKDYKKIKSSIILSILFQLVAISIFTLLIFIFSDTISMTIFRTNQAIMILQIMVLSFLPSIFFSIFQSVFQGYQRIKTYAFVECIRITLTTILASILVLTGFGLVGVAIAYLVTAIVTSIIFSIIFFNIPNIFSSETDFSKPFIKKMFNFAIPMFASGVAYVLISNIDTFILVIFRSFKEVGLYQIALPTSQLLWVFVSAVAVVLFPLSSKLYKRNKETDLVLVIKLLMVFLFLLLLPLIVIVVVFPDIIIKVLFSEQYLEATTIIQILSINAIFYSVFTIFQTVLDGIGKQIISMKNIYLVALFNLTLNFVLVPIFGILGAAIATTTSFIVGCIMSLNSLKILGLKLPWYKLLKIVCGSIFMLFIMFFIRQTLNTFNMWLNVAITLVIGLVFYISYISLTKSVTKKDILLLNTIGLPKKITHLIEKILIK